MWHEARKQERKIRGIMVDYKKRAERRRDFYEKIKADPTQFLQLHGRPVKIHLDPAVALAGDSPANMMPWQGHPDILIDRFDVRAHLDYIPDYPQKTDPPEAEELLRDDRLANYERYRIIVQNEFLGVDEEKFLHQLYLEEQFGPVARPLEVDKKKRGEKAAIPYTYEETGIQEHADLEDEDVVGEEEKDDEDEDDDSDIDFDLCVDVTQVGPAQAHEMNICGSLYGMCGNDFYIFLTRDVEEKESLRLAREQEEEKAMYSGRKSRRERRAFREKRLLGRKISPPSYAARTSPTLDVYRKSVSKSRSRSHSPVNAGQITYITSFGGEEEDGGGTTTSSSKSHPVSSHSAVLATPQSKPRRSRSPRCRSGFRYRSRARNESKSPSCRYGPQRRPDDSFGSRHDSRARDHCSNSRQIRLKSPHGNDHRNSKSKTWFSSSSDDVSQQSHSPGKAQANRRSRSPNNRQPPPPIRRYYGSRKGESSSSELGDSDSDTKQEPTPPKEIKLQPHKNLSSGFGNDGAGTKLQQKLTPQERLKKKMQTLLNRQFKADKRAERMRYEKQEQERQDREEELREMAIKLRRRERERRHRMQDDDDDPDEEEKGSSQSGSRSHSRTSQSFSHSPSLSPPPSYPSAPHQSSSSHRSNRWDKSSEQEGRRHREHSSERQAREQGRSASRSRSWSPSRKSRQRPLVDY